MENQFIVMNAFHDFNLSHATMQQVEKWYCVLSAKTATAKNDIQLEEVEEV